MLVCMAAAMAVQSPRAADSRSIASNDAAAAIDQDDKPSRIAAARRALTERLVARADTRAGKVIKAEVRAIAHDVTSVVDRIMAKVPTSLRQRFDTQSDA